MILSDELEAVPGDLVERLLKKRIQGGLDPETGFGRVMIPDPDCIEAITAIQSLTAERDAALARVAELEAENTRLREALQALSNAADDINGEQDRQLAHERRNWDIRLEDTIVGSVEVSEGQWGELNTAIFYAQQLLRALLEGSKP